MLLCPDLIEIQVLIPLAADSTWLSFQITFCLFQGKQMARQCSLHNTC